ncbi:ABC transporter substrate-binding protein [Eoetvoesiella caeni]|uniref:Peptide/nickel transport system substrate-binding protein n=1 Tax=Eoetvoesiella caeni TaxID=645616 RepID=A0A366HIT1_9BURK|nr:ABC transporter substrate-binding protein [Eoetvoesiella caeni]MCI2807908.1 ABC transporter substrate-binding protein [Eoetvoesiella caeni]NYT54090.1 ABC transporter substrate-binding protein [Eoetvoesiella caeni]RBP41826.1 peptide/nickel transport system substrate-binding protein [Eoetvoesiella caeni]
MQEKIKIDRRSFMVSGAAAALAASMWPMRDLLAQGAEGKDTLVISYPSDVPSWDPTALTLPIAQSIYATVFDSPLRYTKDLKLGPMQITEWKWLDDKKQRLAITLHDGITFHDGSKMTMEDVKWSLLEHPAENPKLAIRGMFPTLTDVEISSPTQAVLVYKKPTPTAPIFLGFLAAFILPKAYIKKVGMDGFLEKPIGAGPYRIVQYQRGSRLVLEAYDGYWGKKPAVKNVVFLFTPEASSRVALVESKRASLATDIPIRETERLSKTPGITSEIYPISAMYMIKVPSYVKPFDNDNVRKALHLSIDKQALSKALYAGKAPVLSIVATKGTPAYIDDYAFPYDTKEAIALLAKEGYSVKNPVKIRLLTTNGAFPNDYDMARVLASMWKKVGIDATVEETTAAKVMELSHNQKITGLQLYNWANATGDPDNGAGRILDPRLRFSMWRDESIGGRIDALFSETDEKKRIAGYQALLKEASEKSWVIPLLQGVATIAHDSTLNVELQGNGYVSPRLYSWQK